MIVYTDSIPYACQMLPELRPEGFVAATYSYPNSQRVVHDLMEGRCVWQSALDFEPPWKELYLVERASQSQFDVLLNVSRCKYPLSSPVLCAAGHGEGFHGFHNRSWQARAGNLHVCAFVEPGVYISNFGIGFTVLAAVSALEAIQSIPGLSHRVGIKWINDLLLDEAKVCGVLAQTQSQGGRVTCAILGIGINVESTPEIDSTPFVNKTICLRDACEARGVTQSSVFRDLSRCLGRNYLALVREGIQGLVETYRHNSLIMGRNVKIYDDTLETAPKVLAQGRVKDLGDQLEIFLEGHSQPIVKGRVAMSPLEHNGGV